MELKDLEKKFFEKLDEKSKIEKEIAIIRQLLADAAFSESPYKIGMRIKERDIESEIIGHEVPDWHTYFSKYFNLLAVKIKKDGTPGNQRVKIYNKPEIIG